MAMLNHQMVNVEFPSHGRDDAPRPTTGPHTGRAAPTQTFLAKNVTNRGTDLFRKPPKNRKNV